MLRLAGFALRSKNRRLPHAIAALPAPALRHGWGNIERMSDDDRRDVVAGAWTHAKPVRLLPDTADRDSGGFVDGVHFSTDDEAEAFLAEEATDEAAERGIPALQLARDFFEELAQTADSEVDVENALVATGTSDADRADEERDVNRHFFADFYVQQGLICEEERYRFVDSMLRPPTAMVMVNAGLPFVRLMVQCQLERHMRDAQAEQTGAVFVPNAAHSLLYMVDMVPTQRIGDPLRLPYNEERSILAKRGAGDEVGDGHKGDGHVSTASKLTADSKTELIGLEADLMEALMNDEAGVGQLAPVGNREGENTSDDLLPDRQQEETAVRVQPQVARAPLSIGHVYWLQRQVAAGTLVDMDPLGVMIPLVLGLHRCDSGGIILDMSSRSHGVQQCVYSKDIASHLTVSRTDQQSERERVSEVVVISLVSPDTSQRKMEYHHDRQKGIKASHEDIPAENGLIVDDLHQHVEYHLGIEGCITARGPSRRVWDLLRRVCDVVLCCPDTTADGRRPRAALGTGGKEDTAEMTVANNFVSVCSRVNKLFPYLRRELAQALEYASPRGGRVVYATRSMNPLENEAVVCSVLTDFRRKHPECTYRPVSILEKQPEDVVDVLHTLMDGSQHGLQTWVGLENGPPEQEVTYSDEDVIAAVTRHAWRADPLKTEGDVSFICVIELQESSMDLLSSSSSSSVTQPLPLLRPLQPSDEASAVTPPLCAFPWLDTVSLRGRWGLAIHWDEERDAFLAVTSSVLLTMEAFRRNHSLDGYSVSDYGVRVDAPLTSHGRLRRRQQQQQQQRQEQESVVSCSLGGTSLALAFSDCVREKDRPSRLLEFPVPVLLDLLHARRLSSQRLSQLLAGTPAAPSLAAAAATLPPIGEKRTVFLKAVPPAAFDPGLSDMELHETVTDELRKLVIVAHVHADRRPLEHGANFVLTLGCTTAHERGLLEERVVAIGDALQFLLRRLGHPLEVCRPGSNEGDQQAQMQEDEYEVERQAPSPPSDDVDSLLSTQERQKHDRNMRRLRGKLHVLGDTSSSEGGFRTDWERDLQHMHFGKYSSVQRPCLRRR
ncbi:hypothetical protein DQ04_01701010 [Trypanosoma grayi]|uniref:hypothetical protein n=1 Tax=Trypanosoma grayi TaxID=71804 RepID=UPI0004F4342B|nr:hypothetical protein DQ04_01701010 [Trypanosoma grayi]KEG12450.1 hypothetical protein DQ04_01701010 [Trypanosoma grayi]